MFDGEFLEAALAGLVADGAVEGVVDEEEFHDAFAAFLDEGGFGADADAFCDGVGAGDGGAGGPEDFGVAVFVFFDFGGAGGGAGGHAGFDEAHAAVSGAAEFGVVAVVGDFDGGLAQGFDHAGAFGEFKPVSVDLDVDEIHGRGGGAGREGGGAHRVGRMGAGRG